MRRRRKKGRPRFKVDANKPLPHQVGHVPLSIGSYGPKSMEAEMRRRGIQPTAPTHPLRESKLARRRKRISIMRRKGFSSIEQSYKMKGKPIEELLALPKTTKKEETT